MSFWALGGLINGLVSSGFGLFVYLKNRKSPINRLWIIFSFTVAFWSYSYFFWQTSTERSLALFWCRSLTVGAIFIPVTCLHFLLVWLKVYQNKKKVLFISYGISLICVILNFTPLFVKDVLSISYFKYWPQAGVAYLPFLIFWTWVVFYCLNIMFQAMRISTGIRRNQIKYVLLSTIIGFCGGFTNYPLWFGIKILPYGNILVSVYVAIMGYAIVQYRLMEIEVIIRKALVFSGVYAPIFALFFLITFYGQEGIRETFSLLGIPVNRWMVVALGATFVAITIRPLNNFLVRKTDRFLFQKKYDYQKVLKDASRGMARVTELKYLLGLIVHFISARVRVEHTAILLRNKEGDRYIIHASRGYHGKPFENFLASDSATVKWLQEKRDVILYEEIDHFLSSGSFPKGKVYSKETLTEIKEEMAKIRAALCIPSFIRHDLIGILVLGDKKSKDIYAQQDLDMLLTLAHEAAIAISNAQSYEELKNTQAQLLHEEKLATIGRMANAIGHEINNPLSILFMNLQTMERDLKENKKLSPEAVSEKLEKANQQAQRINVVVKELTHLFRETERGVRGTLDLADLIKESRSLVRYQSGLGESLDNIEIIQDIPEDLPKIRGDSNQLQQVFLNLFTNACQAMGGKGKITVTARISPEEADSVTIKFSDNGPGITKEFLNKIFDYRFTRKEKGKGTGMGLFVVRYIMTLHEGSISAESEPGKGTTFTLKLPIRREEA